MILVMATTVDQYDFKELTKELTLEGVTVLDKKLGRGAYGRVYAVKYRGTVCAAKEIRSFFLIESAKQSEQRRIIESFLRECRLLSKLSHPNIVQFIGVYYSGGIPVMVMEMMADSLTSFVEKDKNITIDIKYSIVHDISLGLCYLHNHDPPIVHCNLAPSSVLLTAHHVAKICDLGEAMMIGTDRRDTMTRAPGTVDFMSPESFTDRPVYGLPLDVFSFAGIILYTFNQQWPRPTKELQFDSRTRKRVALSEVERRQQYLDMMIGESRVIRPLVVMCLNDDPAERPTIAAVCKEIRMVKDAYKKRCPPSTVAVHKLFEHLNVQQQESNENLEVLSVPTVPKVPKAQGSLMQVIIKPISLASYVISEYYSLFPCFL